ncbi:fibronectin type III domain-containing protein [Selenomonadales bacterium OttesenSCG-928-I06]|nr:fibronectin type III domain-containing protein [Selenomonadales bacterium OttesenSCG-928-I06]
MSVQSIDNLNMLRSSLLRQVAPNNIQAQGISVSEIRITWSATQGAFFYKIYRSMFFDGDYIQVGTSTSTSFINQNLASDTEYFYKVQAVGDSGESVLAGPVLGKTNAILIPTGLEATPLSSSSIIVTWSATAGAILYFVYRSTFQNGNYELATTTPNTSFTDTGLDANTTYYYKVAAYNGSEIGLMAGPVSATTFSDNPPQPPLNVVARALSQTSIIVSWSPVNNADLYYVYRSDSENGTYSLVGITPTTNYTDTGLNPGTTYYYKVASLNNSTGLGALSNFTNATTFSLGVPQNVVAQAQSQSTILVTWDPVEGAVSYFVYRSLSPEGPYEFVAGTTIPEYLDTGLTSSTTYFYKVAVFADGFTGQMSDYADATTWPEPPDPHAPDNLHAEAVSSSGINVTWSEVPDVEGYLVYRSLSPDGPFELIATTTDTEYLDEGLSPNTTYYYKVASFVDIFASPEAGPVDATTFPETPTIPKAPCKLKAKTLSDKEILVCWRPVINADGYNIYHSTSCDRMFAYVGTTTDTKFIDTNLIPHKKYYYKVEAYINNYIGPQAGPVCAKTKYPLPLIIMCRNKDK